MNLIRLGPEISFDRPLPPEAIGKDSLMQVPRLEELGTGILDSIDTAAHWRQAAFHSEQTDRLDGPQDPDSTRNMTPELAEIHRSEMTKHLAALGVVELA